MKLSVSIPDELVKKLDALADANFCSRSGAVTIAVREWVANQEAKKLIPALTEAIKNAAAGKTLSEEDQRQLDAWEVLSRQFSDEKK